MYEPADLQRLLRDSQESRKRAWQALQGIRAVIRTVGECELPAPARPPCFETEGRMLQRAVAETAWRLLRDLEELERAVDAIRPAIGLAAKPDNFPQLLITLNRALVKTRVPSKVLEQFRR